MTNINIGDTELIRFDWDFISSHMYLIRRGSDALVIDPVDTAEVREYMIGSGIKDCKVLLTHEHFDHISGVGLLRSLCVCEVICSRVCAENIVSSSKNLSDASDAVVLFNAGMSARGCHIEPFTCTADLPFDGELRTEWHGHSVHAFPTPGHSPGSICILLDGKYLFTGDTLLDTPTITRLPRGSRRDFESITLPLLKGLCGSVELVFPGHGEYAGLEALLEKYH